MLRLKNIKGSIHNFVNKELQSKRINKVSQDPSMNSNFSQKNILVLLSFTISKIVILVQASLKPSKEISFFKKRFL